MLGKKDNDQKWRLLGGFSDPTNDSYEASALRELQEECGKIEVAPMKYEGSFRVNDWRYRNEADKIITTLFSTEFIAGNPEGSDDIAEVNWFPISELPGMIERGLTAPEHMPQLTRILERYNK